VRIPLPDRLLMTDDARSRRGWALLDRSAGLGARAGLLAILDLHAAPRPDPHHHDDGPGYPLMFYVCRRDAR